MDKWKLYMGIHQLKRQGFKKAQIARKLGLSRTTVIDYLKLSPEEMGIWEAGTQKRTKKLDPFHNEILSWLKEHEEILSIIDVNGNIIAEHNIAHGKGQLIQDTNHRRDRTKGIDAYIQTVAAYFGDTAQSTAYLEKIRSLYPRYISTDDCRSSQKSRGQATGPSARDMPP